MSTEEQIKEMAKICCYICEFEHCGKCLNDLDLGDCYIAMHTAQKLYNAGYQKVSEIVAKIFEELKEKYTACFFDGTKDIITFRKDDLEELEKKYTESEGTQ